MAVVQGTLLYAVELTWNSQRDMEGEYQAIINRNGRGRYRHLLFDPSGNGYSGEQAGVRPSAQGPPPGPVYLANSGQAKGGTGLRGDPEPQAELTDRLKEAAKLRAGDEVEQ